MVVARKYVLRSHFHGLPKREDLEVVEEVLPELKDGGSYFCYGATIDSFQGWTSVPIINYII